MITFKRGTGKHNSDTKVVDIYNFYLKHKKKEEDIKQFLFSKVLEDYHDYKINQAIYRNIPFHMPYLGKLEVVKSKPTVKIIDDKLKINLPINYKKTKELWEQNSNARAEKKVVYHLNEESDKYVMKWKWSKTTVVRNKSVYKLAVLRKLKRRITVALKNTNYKIDFYLEKKSLLCQK